jgi:serine/threonine protein kinase
MESFETNSGDKDETYEILDYEEASFFPILRRLPRELAQKHLQYVVQEGLDDDEALAYLEDIFDKRKEATTISVISDESAQELFQGHEKELFARIETDVFDSPDNLIGAGTTARVKRFDLTQDEKVIPMALKYLVTPNEKTLSASAEHDMISEVERIQRIENIERDSNFEYIGVPHPYFHHKNQRIQCYGMQLIDGCDLNKTVTDLRSDVDIEAFKEQILKTDISKLDKEIEDFFAKMHTYCLHGDIKPRNIMVDTSGKFFIIDFGQSVLVNDIPEKGLEQFEELKAEEVRATKFIIKQFIQHLTKEIA